MNYFVYILYSLKLDSFYVGQTGNIGNRIREHNQGIHGAKSTKQSNDWTLFCSIVCNSRRQAIQIEKHIKKMRNRKYYHNLKNIPEISARLLETYP